MNYNKPSIRDMCHIGIFTAIIAVCAQISIPMPVGVPFTLQTFAISLAGIVLGVRRGMLATAVYILLGAVGVPVFANFTAGAAVIFGRTGGFILSFPLMALAAGIGAKGRKPWLAVWLAAGAAANFACGMLMFSFVTRTPLAASFAVVAAPFLPLSVVEIVLLVGLGGAVRQALVKSGVL